MISRILKSLFNYILTTGIIVGIGLIILGALAKEPVRFSYEDIIKIKPTAVVDPYTLLNASRTREFQKDLIKNLISKKVIAVHPAFGIIPNPDKTPYPVNIIIDSGGGYVTAGFVLKAFIDKLKDVGIQTRCYVANAQSMAFYLMVTSCDYVVMKKGAVIMQHKVRHSNDTRSISTKMTDLKMAKDEAAELGVDFKEWLEFTRGSTEDRVFTEADIKKYGLVDEVM